MITTLLIIFFVSTIILNKILTQYGVPYRIRLSYLVRCVVFFIGISSGVLVGLWKNHNEIEINGLGISPSRTWRLLPDGTFLHPTDDERNLVSISNVSLTYEKLAAKKVIFITTTDHSVLQAPLLTKLGQAVFPVRDIVKWIVVSLPFDSSEEDVNGNRAQVFNATNMDNTTLMYLHLQNLNRTLARFGVSYVLLSSDNGTVNNTSWAGFQWPLSTSRVIRGYQTGLLWVLKNLLRGVIMLGDENYSYNSAIFSELQFTNFASCWPLGLTPYDTLPASMPLTKTNANTERLEVVGYDDGKNRQMGSVLIELGAFAIDLEHLRTVVPYYNHWKLVLDRVFTSDEFKISLTKIQVMSKQGSEIYVWRTHTVHDSWPSSVSVSNNMKHSNIHQLLRNMLGPRYNVMKNLIKTENHSHYDNYDFERDIKAFIE